MNGDKCTDDGMNAKWNQADKRSKRVARVLMWKHSRDQVLRRCLVCWSVPWFWVGSLSIPYAVLYSFWPGAEISQPAKTTNSTTPLSIQTPHTEKLLYIFELRLHWRKWSYQKHSRHKWNTRTDSRAATTKDLRPTLQQSVLLMLSLSICQS